MIETLSEIISSLSSFFVDLKIWIISDKSSILIKDEFISLSLDNWFNKLFISKSSSVISLIVFLFSSVFSSGINLFKIISNKVSPFIFLYIIYYYSF